MRKVFNERIIDFTLSDLTDVSDYIAPEDGITITGVWGNVIGGALVSICIEFTRNIATTAGTRVTIGTITAYKPKRDAIIGGLFQVGGLSASKIYLTYLKDIPANTKSTIRGLYLTT